METRIIMAHNVAYRWIMARVQSEYRVQVYYGAKEYKNIPGLLRSFRDGKLKIGSISPITDLGVHEEFDSFTIWSSDHKGLTNLKNWFEKHGFETSGIW